MNGHRTVHMGQCHHIVSSTVKVYNSRLKTEIIMGTFRNGSKGWVGFCDLSEGIGRVGAKGGSSLRAQEERSRENRWQGIDGGGTRAKLTGSLTFRMHHEDLLCQNSAQGHRAAYSHVLNGRANKCMLPEVYLRNFCVCYSSILNWFPPDK